MDGMTKQDSPNEDRMVRFAEGLTMLGVSKSTAYRMIERGDLPQPVKVGSLTFFSARELQHWIAQKLTERDAGASNG